jgi:SAM-dependent methyltransferase
VGCCGHCESIESEFGERTAGRELKRYRRRGPPKSTRLLLDLLRSEADGSDTLLDIGGGVGALHHELLASGTVTRATHVDAASAYLETARQESKRRGTEERVAFVHGDFVELAERVPPADIVTLDRVLCCYPGMERLVGASAARAERLYGVVYPRNRWWLRMAFPLPNLWFRLRGSDFRVYLHTPERIDEAIRAQGLEPVVERRTLVWHVALYTRRQAHAGRS